MSDEQIERIKRNHRRALKSGSPYFLRDDMIILLDHIAALEAVVEAARDLSREVEVESEDGEYHSVTTMGEWQILLGALAALDAGQGGNEDG